MAGNAQNGLVHAQEDAEQGKKKQSRNFVREFVTPFLEEKLSGKDGGQFYLAAKRSKGNVRSDFLKYWKSRDAWNNLSAPEKNTVEKMEKDLFLRELVRIGTSIESKRDTLEKLFDREFDLSDDQRKNIRSEIQSLSTDELAKHLSFGTTRKELIARVFPKKGTEPLGHDLGRQFEVLFEHNKVSLNEDQKQKIFHLLTAPYVDESHVDEILDLFPKLEEKQLIVKYFLPTVTLGDLQRMGILIKSQVTEYIRQCVKEQYIGKDFSVEEELIESIEPDDIILPTLLLPEPALDRLLAGKGKEAIIRQIESRNQEVIEESESGNTLGLTLDDDDSFLSNFQTRLRGLGIKNPEDFREGSYIRGKVKQADGTFQNFHFAITHIEDDPMENKKNGGRGKQVTVTNVLTSDGFIDKNWRKNKTPEQPRNYSVIFALLEKAVKGKKGFPEIATQEALADQIENGDVTEKILREDISSLEALNDALDTVDVDGKKYPLQKGSSVQVGEPGKEGFWVFQIKSINEETNTIAISDGTSQEILDYQTFFDNFASKEGKRLQKLETPEDFLRAIQEHSPKAKAFEKIVFNKDRGIFMPEDRKDDKDFPGILQFGGEKETITLHERDASGLAGWTIGTWEEGKKADEKKGTPATPGKYTGEPKGYKAEWNALYAQFLSLRMTPKDPEVPLTPPEQKEMADRHEHSGFLKHYMGNPSLHDMFAGAKGLVDLIKHKLEHGSKVHAAKFQLALGQKLLGWDDATMRELRSKVHGTTRELMEQMVKELSGLPSGERHKEVQHILNNKGSHDYEVQAAILSMLKKHGTLYVGALKPMEGSFAYFERLSGTKYSKSNPHVQRALKACHEQGILFREEFLIENYLQYIGGAAGGYQVDWSLWLEIKKGWFEGMNGEKEGGEKQAAAFATLDGRLNWTYGKFAGGEYAHGIGAMQKVWSKGGPAHKMHEPVMYMALSNIPSRLHGSQLDALKNEFYGGGHPYPALTALFTPEKLATFQKTVKILCENDAGMKKAYDAIEKARNVDVGKTVTAIRDFWNTYGVELHKKLLISQDPEVLFRAQHDPDSEVRETLATYVKNYKGDTENMGPLNNDELGEGVYGYDHSGFVWSTDAYLKKTKVDRGPGTLGDDDGTKALWKGYLQSLDDIKKQKFGSEEEDRKFQYERFKEHHKAFYRHIFDRSGADWADEDKTGKKKIEKQTYMIDLIKRGFSVPPWKDKDKLDKPEYDHIVRRDFENYLNGDHKTARDETETVATSISELLGHPASNDPQSRQAA